MSIDMGKRIVQSPAVNELQFYLLQDAQNAQNARGNGIDIDTVSEENSVKRFFLFFSVSHRDAEQRRSRCPRQPH